MKDEYGAFGSVVLTGENQSSWSLEKVYVPAALCLPLIPHGLASDQSQSSMFKDQQLTV
jgi:hypothetical protein